MSTCCCSSPACRQFGCQAARQQCMNGYYVHQAVVQPFPLVPDIKEDLAELKRIQDKLLSMDEEYFSARGKIYKEMQKIEGKLEALEKHFEIFRKNFFDMQVELQDG